MIYHTRRLLSQCLLISLTVHITLLTFFYYHPFILHESISSLFAISSATPEIIREDEEALDLQKKSQLLEEVFQQILLLSSHQQPPFDLSELPKGMALAPDKELPRAEFSPHFESPLSLKSETPFPLSPLEKIQHLDLETIAPLFPLSQEEIPVASQLQIDCSTVIAMEIGASALPLLPNEAYEDVIATSNVTLTATYEEDASLAVYPAMGKNSEKLQIEIDQKVFSSDVRAKDLSMERESFRPSLFIPKAQEMELKKREVEISSRDADLEQYQFPSIATASEWNDDFNVDVHFLPNPDGPGYIFSVALSPNYEISNYSLKQNFYFILDRSNSIQKHRFSVFKRAILKALASMQPEDTFNILVIDKKTSKFKIHNVTASMKNLQAAEEFLDKQEAGDFFSSGEIYSSLEKLLPSIPENDEMHTIVLLTNGKTNLTTERKQKVLNKWMERNQSRISLYAAAVGRDNDLLTLDLLSANSGGRLLYSDTHASFPRKLAKLVLDLKDPVAKNLIFKAIPHNPHSHIKLHPSSSHSQALYSHQPYVIYGQIDEPCTFDLLLQGRHRDLWIAIKKSISFIEGKKGDRNFESKWDAQRANLYYTKFLEEGKKAHLKIAKEILKKSRTDIVFE